MGVIQGQLDGEEHRRGIALHANTICSVRVSILISLQPFLFFGAEHEDGWRDGGVVAGFHPTKRARRDTAEVIGFLLSVR